MNTTKKRDEEEEEEEEERDLSLSLPAPRYASITCVDTVTRELYFSPSLIETLQISGYGDSEIDLSPFPRLTSLKLEGVFHSPLSLSPSLPLLSHLSIVRQYGLFSLSSLPLSPLINLKYLDINSMATQRFPHFDDSPSNPSHISDSLSLSLPTTLVSFSFGAVNALDVVNLRTSLYNLPHLHTIRLRLTLNMTVTSREEREREYEKWRSLSFIPNSFLSLRHFYISFSPSGTPTNEQIYNPSPIFIGHPDRLETFEDHSRPLSLSHSLIGSRLRHLSLRAWNKPFPHSTCDFSLLLSLDLSGVYIDSWLSSPSLSSSLLHLSLSLPGVGIGRNATKRERERVRERERERVGNLLVGLTSLRSLSLRFSCFPLPSQVGKLTSLRELTSLTTDFVLEENKEEAGSEGEREIETEKGRETEKERETEKVKEIERENERETEKVKEIERENERENEREREDEERKPIDFSFLSSLSHLLHVNAPLSLCLYISHNPSHFPSLSSLIPNKSFEFNYRNESETKELNMTDWPFCSSSLDVKKSIEREREIDLWINNKLDEMYCNDTLSFSRPLSHATNNTVRGEEKEERERERNKERETEERERHSLEEEEEEEVKEREEKRERERERELIWERDFPALICHCLQSFDFYSDRSPLLPRLFFLYEALKRCPRGSFDPTDTLHSLMKLGTCVFDHNPMDIQDEEGDELDDIY